MNKKHLKNLTLEERRRFFHALNQYERAYEDWEIDSWIASSYGLTVEELRELDHMSPKEEPRIPHVNLDINIGDNDASI